MLASVIAACGVIAALLGVIVALGLAVEWLSPATQRPHADPRWAPSPMVRARPKVPIAYRRHSRRRPSVVRRGHGVGAA